MKKSKLLLKIFILSLLVLSIEKIIPKAAGAFPLIIENADYHYGPDGFNNEDWMSAHIITAGDNVAGYSILVAHYQTIGSPQNFWLFIVNFALPWYTASISILSQVVDDLTITVSGIGFNTIVMHLVENGIYKSGAYVSPFVPDTDPKKGTSILTGANIPIAWSQGGQATVTMHVKGKTLIAAMVLFFLPAAYYWASFEYTHTIQCNAYPDM